MKHVWIIDPYSESPEPGWRDGRYFLIAKELSQAGYFVHLFISNFSHKNKSFITDKEQITINSNLKIILVKAPSYHHHISLKRIKYEQAFAKIVAANNYDLSLPTIIILKDPAIFMFKSLKPLLQRSGAKLIIDIIDLWPEMFEFKLPKHIRWMGKLIFYPFYYTRKNIFSAASAITAVAPDYLIQALNYNKDVPGKVIYWGCNLSLIKKEINLAEEKLLQTLNLPEKGNDIWGIYAGTLGAGYDIETLLKTAEVMLKTNPNLIFLIAGTGPMLDKVKHANNQLNNVYYVGTLPTTILYQLFSFCDFGFSTYADGSAVSMPIKCYDYFAAGLPLVNSLGRNLKNLITKNKLGYQYQASDVNSLISALNLILESDLKEMQARCEEISYNFDDTVQYPLYVEVVKSIL